MVSSVDAVQLTNFEGTMAYVNDLTMCQHNDCLGPVLVYGLTLL